MTLRTDDPFDIKLSAGREGRPYGLILDEGSQALTIGAVGTDDTVYIRNVGKRPGDFDEQRSWKGGRGHEKFNDNDEGYWDSENAWTLTKGHVHSGILWKFAKGLRSATDNFTDSKSWQALNGATLGVSVSFSPDDTANYDKAQIWVRWKGDLAATNTLTMKLHSDSTGVPGTALQTVTKSVTDADVISKLIEFDWSGTESLTSGTTYHITLAGADTSTENAHWEVAIDPDTSTSKVASDPNGSPSWVTPATEFSMLFRITDADTGRTFKPFFLDNHMYVVSQNDDGTTASQLYINGDRGQATGGSTTTLVDTGFGCRTSAWADDTLAGAKIRFKKNGKWYYATIASHTGGTYTFESATAVAPASGNNYFIYATEWFTEITSTGLGVVLGEPAVLNGNVYFPQGASDPIRCIAMDYTAGQNHKFRDEAGSDPYANLLLTHYDRGENSAVIWRAEADGTVSYAKSVAYGTDLTFSTPAIAAGDPNDPITGLNKQPGILYVFKEGGLGQVTAGKYTNLGGGMEHTPDERNGVASVVVDKFIYYSWLHSIIRVYGSSFDDVGQDYRSFGLPDGREGYIAYADTYITLPLFAVDAGTGTSSVLAFDGLGWHEIFRAYAASKRVRMVKTQPNPDTRNRVWVDVGGELAYMEMPLKKSSPTLDSGMKYMHETVVESSIIDMGAASDLPKFIKSMAVTVKNLSASGRYVSVDYQIDEDCHTTTWIPASELSESPESSVLLNLQNIRRFVYRLRMNTNDATKPIDVEGIVPSGYARTPLKQIFTMRIRAGGVYKRGTQTERGFSKLWRWLMDHARAPYSVLMESKYEEFDGYYVIVHPPRAYPYKPPRMGQQGEAVLTLVLEEV